MFVIEVILTRVAILSLTVREVGICLSFFTRAALVETSRRSLFTGPAAAAAAAGSLLLAAAYFCYTTECCPLLLHPPGPALGALVVQPPTHTHGRQFRALLGGL